MIAHLVLFRPRPDLSASDRQGLADAMTAAIREIPSVRGAKVGRRVRIGAGYEPLMRSDYPYAAVIEFDDVAGLQAYLGHPAHVQLGARFFAAFEEALMYDFELEEGAEAVAGLL